MSDNPVAIVTGGSRGVGAATARMLSENGWNVVITCSSSIQDADQVAKNCTNENAEVVALQADVSKDIECIATINKAIEKWGRIDALINNAGTTKFAWDHSDLDSLAAEDFQYIYGVNVVGPFQMVKAAKEHLLKSKRSSSFKLFNSLILRSTCSICLWIISLILEQSDVGVFVRANNCLISGKLISRCLHCLINNNCFTVSVLYILKLPSLLIAGGNKFSFS